jgi:hypothetical protein
MKRESDDIRGMTEIFIGEVNGVSSPSIIPECNRSSSPKNDQANDILFDTRIKLEWN